MEKVWTWRQKIIIKWHYLYGFNSFLKAIFQSAHLQLSSTFFVIRLGRTYTKDKSHIKYFIILKRKVGMFRYHIPRWQWGSCGAVWLLTVSGPRSSLAAALALLWPTDTTLLVCGDNLFPCPCSQSPGDCSPQWRLAWDNKIRYRVLKILSRVEKIPRHMWIDQTFCDTYTTLFKQVNKTGFIYLVSVVTIDNIKKVRSVLSCISNEINLQGTFISIR